MARAYRPGRFSLVRVRFFDRDSLMRSSFRTFLFGRDRIAVAVSGRSRFAHTFGGPPDRKGTSRAECNGLLIHLLHRLDLTDPAVPFAVPGVRWLPIYYCFDFRANELGYRLVSDEEMMTYFPTDDPNVSVSEEWPDDDYPTEFPRSRIKFAEWPYDPTDLEDAYRWAGVFGVGQLSKRDQAAARARVAEEAELFGSEVPRTKNQFAAALSRPFVQGKPDSPCLNPTCPNRDKKGRLQPIVLMPAEPVKGVRTFGPATGVELVVEMCPRCYTFRVSNQST